MSCFKSLIVLLIVGATVIQAVRVELCHENACHNGGTCYKAGDSLDDSFCDPSFTPYQRSCYKLVKTSKAWSQAQKDCATLQANLVSLDSRLERYFVEALLRQNLPDSGTVNVWTSGQFFNATSAAPADYYWTKATLNTTGPIGKRFWDPEQPAQPYEANTFSTHYADTCLVLSSVSGFRNWSVQNCEHSQNVYVCEKPDVRPKIDPAHYLYQCRCTNGFTGSHCELSTGGDWGQSADPSQKTVCGDAPFEFSCPAPLTIDVDYAAYGRPLDSEPPACANMTGDQSDSRCVAENSLRKLIEKCQGLSSCTIPQLSSAFPVNPCLPGSQNYLDYRFRCAQDQPRCHVDSTFFGNRCYQIVYVDERSSRKGWPEAKQSCMEKGGDLVGPIDDAVHKFLMSQFANIVDNKVKYFWIGLRASDSGANNGKLTDGTWTNGAKMSFSPNGSRFQDGDCVSYYVQPSRDSIPSAIMWLAKNCLSWFNWVCEFAPIGGDRPKLFDPSWNATTTTDVPLTTTPKLATIGGRTSQTFVEESTRQQSSVAPTTTTTLTQQRSEQPSGQEATECSSTSASGFQWPETAEGVTASVACPVGSGFAYWLCKRVNGELKFSSDGPDTSECSQETSTENILTSPVVEPPRVESSTSPPRGLAGSSRAAAEKPIDDLSIDFSKTPVDRTLSRLDELNRLLMGGNISAELIRRSIRIVELLIGVRRIASDARRKELVSVQMATQASWTRDSSSFTEKVGNNTNLLLAPVAAWRDFNPTDRLSNATQLILNLEESAALLARDMPGNQTSSFNSSNIDFTAHVTRFVIDPNVKFPINDPPPILTRKGTVVPPPGLPTSNSPWTFASGGSSVSLPTNLFMLADVPQVAPEGVYQEGIAEYELRLGFYLYRDHIQAVLGSDAVSSIVNGSTKVIGSQVVGATVQDPRVSHDLPAGQEAVVEIRHREGLTEVRDPVCVFWNTDSKLWDNRGCRLVNSTATSSFCACNHLTSFAVLMDVVGAVYQFDPENTAIQRVLSRIGCGISAICLAICVCVFTCLWPLWSDRTSIHRNLCVCLLVGELLFLFGLEQTQIPELCTTIAAVLQYIFLAAFCWMLMEGFQLYLMLVRVFETERSYVWYYYLISYGAPLIIVAIALPLHLRDYGTAKYCWIRASSPAIWSFVGPVSFVIALNLVFLGLALYVLCRTSTRDARHGERNKLDNIRRWLKGAAVLTCLLGVTWAVGYFIVINDYTARLAFSYAFVVLNSIQGVFIFVFHVLLNEKVHQAFKRTIRRSLCYTWLIPPSVSPTSTAADKDRHSASNSSNSSNSSAEHKNSFSTLTSSFENSAASQIQALRRERSNSLVSTVPVIAPVVPVLVRTPSPTVVEVPLPRKRLRMPIEPFYDRPIVRDPRLTTALGTNASAPSSTVVEQLGTSQRRPLIDAFGGIGDALSRQQRALPDIANGASATAARRAEEAPVVKSILSPSKGYSNPTFVGHF